MEKAPPPRSTTGFVMGHAYDSDDPEFVRGAEVGSLEAKVELLGDVAVREVMRRANMEMVKRIAESAGRAYAVEPIDDTWMEVVIEPVRSRTRARHGRALRAVD